MKLFLFSLIFISGIYTPVGFSAPTLKVVSLPKQIAAGQDATLTLQVEWPATEASYEINSLEPKVENLTLTDQHQSQETGPVVTHTITYVFRPVKKGAALIYPFEISYRKSETDQWSPLLVPEQQIRVVSGFPVKPILFWFIIPSGLISAIFYVFNFLKRLKERKTSASKPPPDPKQRIYAKAQEAIATFASPDTKIKLNHWSQQFRTVVGTYYDHPAGIASGTALLVFLKSRSLPAGEWNDVSGPLEQLMEAQFSRKDMPAYDLDRLQKTLLQYIRGKIIIENSIS